MTTATTKQKLTPPEIARRYGISPEKVLVWIRSGELKAFDASTNRGHRPRYLVDIDDPEAFKRSRQAVPPTTPTRRKKAALPAGFVRHFR